jgi:uncharacterized repeat protein (TIGR02543 family)
MFLLLKKIEEIINLKIVIFCFIIFLFLSLLSVPSVLAFSAGTGRDSDPWIITNSVHLSEVKNYLGNSHTDKYFKLGDDIDLTFDTQNPAGKFYNLGSGWGAIGIEESINFQGNFDGDGYVITGLYINKPSTNYQGLFGYIGQNGKVENLGLKDVNITGREFVGGVSGYIENGEISNSYSTGSVSAEGYVGGFVGANQGTITHSYSTGSVSAGEDVGGFIGKDLEGFIENSFWDKDTSEQETSGGQQEIGKTTTEMTTQTTFTNEGWNFSSNGNWFMIDGFTRPFLRMEWSIKIKNTHQLQLMAMDLNETYTLINDIDFNSHLKNKAGMWVTDMDNATPGSGFVPIGNRTNFGRTTLRGEGNIIKNLFIKGDINNANVGLFGYIEGGAITALGLQNINITGGDHTGGLVGEIFEGEITESYVTGSVTGEGDYTGGIIGRNKKGKIEKSYAISSVNGNNNVGGLIGMNDGGAVLYSYSAGAVEGISNLGGLVGNKILGELYEDVANFWDIDVSGQNNSTMGIGIDTHNMKNINFFIEGGWNIVLAPNYNDEDWYINQENDYPRLGWQYEIFTLTYSASSGGSIIGNVLQEVFIGESGTAVTANPDAGYSFLQWSDGSTNNPRTDQNISKNINVEAEFTPNTYELIFNTQGGTPSPNNQEVIFDSVVGELPTPEKIGYYLSRWNTSSDGSGTNYTADTIYTVVGDTTLYAQWTIKQYTLTFDSAGGSAIEAITQDYDTTITPPADPTKTGYSFNDWNPALPATMPASNETHTAQWTANSYNVTFNANGGSGSMDAQTITFDISENLNANTFTRNGYTFNNWNTLENGSGTAYDNKSSFTMNIEGQTLYAQWTIKQYTLTYLAESNGSILGEVSQTINYGENGSVVTAVPDSGYLFVRWSDNSTDNPRTDINITNDITISAIFDLQPPEPRSGTILLPPPAIGIGVNNFTIPMGEVVFVGNIASQGINILNYINSQTNFNTLVSKTNTIQNHSLSLNNLDMLNKKVILILQSEPTIITLALGETKKIDLDKDSIYDIEVIFIDLLVNRVEITVRNLLEDTQINNDYEGKLVKYTNSPKIYLIQQNKKRWIINEQAFNYHNYKWNEIIIIETNIIFKDGVDIIKTESPSLIKTGYVFIRNLKIGMIGDDVLKLQKYLNTNGYKLANTGPGSPDKETTIFGKLTHNAVVRFQQANNLPAYGFFGPMTREIVNN